MVTKKGRFPRSGKRPSDGALAGASVSGGHALLRGVALDGGRDLAAAHLDHLFAAQVAGGGLAAFAHRDPVGPLGERGAAFAGGKVKPGGGDRHRHGFGVKRGGNAEKRGGQDHQLGHRSSPSFFVDEHPIRRIERAAAATILPFGSANVQNERMADYVWNDLKYLLAVAERGSTLAAARALGANQTTIARRIAALEEALGTALFERRQAGYRLTATGEKLLPLAQAVAAAARAVSEEVASEQREVSGTVRVSTLQIYAEWLLTPALAALRRAHPHLRIELDQSHEPRDLGAGEADVALRVADRFDQDALVARRICGDRWTFYCSTDYAAAHGTPSRPDEIARHPIIGGGGPGVWDAYRAYLDALPEAIEPETMYDSSTGLMSAVRSGLGIAVLPCIVADTQPDLVRCLPPGKPRSTLWLVTHERVRHAPHVRAVMDVLGDTLVERAKALGLD